MFCIQNTNYYTSVSRVYSLSRALSHQQHLIVRTKQVWSLGSVRLRGCECNHMPLVCAPNKPAETLLKRGSRFASKWTLVRFAWDVKVNAPRSDPVLKSIRLFGRHRHPLNRSHYGNYCLISGNGPLSDRRVKMSRGSIWSKEETECLFDIWADAHIKRMHTLKCRYIYHIPLHDEGEGVRPIRSADQWISRWISNTFSQLEQNSTPE